MRDLPTTSDRGRTTRPLPFAATVGLASAATFAAVLFHEEALSLLARPTSLTTSAEREHAPPTRAFYRNCDAARAAGVAPIHAGEPGYREEMDGDSDGIACEPYRGW